MKYFDAKYRIFILSKDFDNTIQCWNAMLNKNTYRESWIGQN